MWVWSWGPPHPTLFPSSHGADSIALSPGFTPSQPSLDTLSNRHKLGKYQADWEHCKIINPPSIWKSTPRLPGTVPHGGHPARSKAGQEPRCRRAGQCHTCESTPPSHGCTPSTTWGADTEGQLQLRSRKLLSFHQQQQKFLQKNSVGILLLLHPPAP